MPKPPVNPDSATTPLCLVERRMLAVVLPPTASIAPAQQRNLGMNVNVDEAGSQNFAGSVNVVGRGGRRQVADGGDLVPEDADVGGERWIFSGAVGDRGGAYYGIKWQAALAFSYAKSWEQHRKLSDGATQWHGKNTAP